MTTFARLRRLERDRQRRAGDADGVPFPLAGEQVHRRRADEAGDVDRQRPGEDLARRADLDDAAVHEDGDAVGERHRLFLVVRDVDGRDAERALQLAQLEARLEAQLGVEVGERLVEQEEARLADDRARERDALLLAARELARRSLQQVADADLGGGAGDRARRSRRARRRPSSAGSRCSARPSCADRARSSGTPSRRRARRALASSRRRRPCSTRPAFTDSRPARMRSVVVLPDPDGPSRTKNSPGSIARSMPCSTVVGPCCLTTPSMRTRARRASIGSHRRDLASMAKIELIAGLRP